MTDFPSNTVISAAAVTLTLEPIAEAQTISGTPRTGAAKLGSFSGLEIGVWEMTAGAMHDIEVDELFVVISGSARVDFDNGAAPLELAAGDVVNLAAGMQTTWTVRETLRKVYLAPDVS